VYVAENPDAKLKLVYSITTDLSHGYAFKKGNTELIDKVNAGLKQIIDDGTWERLHKQFEPNAPTPEEFAPQS
jgi:polar amino acid transport system substrate-binding protein